MSIPTQELSRKLSAHSDNHPSSEEKKPSHFRKLWKVDPIDEKRNRSLFSLIEEEHSEEIEEEHSKEDEAIFDGPALLIVENSSPPGQHAEIKGASAATSSLEMELLLEKMASRMIMMDLAQETHTTLFLDSPQFAASPFFGTKIVIKEFSTAPKAFNIEIISNPTAISTIQQHQQNLLALFALGNFNFTVHRLETHLFPAADVSLPNQHEEESEHEEQQKDDHP